MGPKYHPGLQNTLQYGTLPERHPRIGSEEGGCIHFTGDSVTPGQWCNNPSTLSPGEFFLHSLYSSQKRWRMSHCNKPEMPEQVYPHVDFKGIQSLRDVLPGDFMIRRDLKDTYF